MQATLPWSTETALRIVKFLQLLAGRGVWEKDH